MPNKNYWKYKKLKLCRRCGAQPLPDKTRCLKCHRAHLSYQKKAKKKLKKLGMCNSCGVAPRLTGIVTCQRCLDENIKRQKKRYIEIKNCVIKAYGGQCVCCGTTVKKYLQLDHINNDGEDHRKKLGNNKYRSGIMYIWAKKK